VTVLALARPRGEDQPDGRRWRPVRAGVLNVWRYYDEVFTFHSGRLLLRGPNGTGKSKALELLLPYLFDANLRPSRLSTFGGSERTMHWNLMGDGYPNTTRVGYVWLEFGRDGEWFTCGARLAASTNTRSVDATYFTTSARIGKPGGLSVVKSGDVPLTRQDLVAAIGDRGTVHSGAEPYRRTVRETLFRGLSAAQYDALIATLLQLRTPKLSEHLNPDALSEVLSKALPPVDPADLAEIAEGFEKLDQRRERLSRLDAEVAAATRLAERQRRYARRALRRGAGELISATTQLDNVTRTARRSREEHETARAELAALRDRLADIEQEQGLTEEAVAGLQNSAAYREGAQLDDLRAQVRQAHRAAESSSSAAHRRQREADDDARAVSDRSEDVALTAGQVDRSWQDTADTALRAGLAAHVEPLRGAAAEQARTILRGMISGREREIADVRGALAVHHQAVADRDRAQRIRDRAAEGHEQARNALDQRIREHRDELDELRERILGWTARWVEIPLAGPAADLADLADDEAALGAVVADLAARVRETLAGEHVTAVARRDDLRSRREPLAAERSALAAARLREPTPPAVRTAPRAERSGAPLWQLVEWRPGVPSEAHAAIEAAAQAAGLLDSWVWPDGSVTHDRRGHDTYLAAAVTAPAPAGSLLDVLDADSDTEVPPAVVRRLLAAVAYGQSAPAHAAAVGADGSWRLGPAYGTWAKADAEYIGAAARERARQRRLAELAAAIAAIDADQSVVTATLATLAARRSAVDSDLAARPSHAGAVAAADRVTRAELRLATVSDALAAADAELSAAQAGARASLRELTLIGSRLGLPTSAADLDQLAGGVATLRQAADGWLAARVRAEHAAARFADAEATAGRSRSAAEEGAAAAVAANEYAAGLRARLDAVDQTVGVEYRAVLDEIDNLRRRIELLKREARGSRPRNDELIARISELKARTERADSDREEAAAVRDGAVDRLSRLARLLGPDAAVSTDLSALGTVTPTLQAARQLAEEMGSLAHGPRHLRQDEAQLADVLHTIRDSLAGYADLGMDADEDCDVQVVAATVDGVRTSPSALVVRLTAERDETRAHLTEEERKLFDRTLTGDTRRHVAERIRQAADLVGQISTQLEQVRTVSGLGVRLVWEVDTDLDPRLRRARDLLLQDPARLTDSQRDALHEFFRGRIDDLRATGAAASWEQHLTDVLDYRTWHRFVVQMRTGGDWVAVTRRQHGAKSGGEKAIVLHLPLFAAAAAHYRAAPTAPRLILLDEVFVGVDQTNRGQLMEVLTSLDLDLMLTSDQEWCTYAEVDGIAIHQLIAGDEDGDDAVTTARFVWTGRAVVAADD
jgi:uncharacterized protein (TIGR02680 family)